MNVRFVDMSIQDCVYECDVCPCECDSLTISSGNEIIDKRCRTTDTSLLIPAPSD